MPLKSKTIDLLFNTVGTTGVAIVLLAYYLLQNGAWRSDDIVYLAANITGSTLILVSLIRFWNLPSAIIQIAFIIISIYGLLKGTVEF